MDTFHTLHFPRSALVASPPYLDQQQAPEPQSHNHYEEEVDELGYYADGVKRTLTDEQIAMFRHSEIQQLLKERRRRREQELDDREAQDEQAGPQPNASGAPVRASASATMIQCPDAVPSPTTEQLNKEEDAKLPKRENRKRKKKAERQETVEEQKTSRRLARELDEVQAANIELDY